jgi:uncharacterized protein (DUF697 family)
MKITAKIRQEITHIELRDDLSQQKKISNITHIACATCAGVSIQPLPFADIFILTPLQGYFASRIAAIHGVPISENEALDWVKEIIGLVGLGMLAQQLALGVWKTVTFGFGGLLSIPLVYGLTYAIMKVADAYFAHKAQNEQMSEEQIKAIWQQAFKQGQQQGKAQQDHIRHKDD